MIFETVWVLRGRWICVGIGVLFFHQLSEKFPETTVVVYGDCLNSCVFGKKTIGWLVVWNTFYFSIYWECHHPN